MDDSNQDVVAAKLGIFDLLVPRERVIISSRVTTAPNLGCSIHFIDTGSTLTILQCSPNVAMLTGMGLTPEELEAASNALQEPFGQRIAGETLASIFAEFEVVLNERNAPPDAVLQSIFTGIELKSLRSQRKEQVAALAEIGKDTFLFVISYFPEHRDWAEGELPRIAKMESRSAQLLQEMQNGERQDI